MFAYSFWYYFTGNLHFEIWSYIIKIWQVTIIAVLLEPYFPFLILHNSRCISVMCMNPLETWREAKCVYVSQILDTYLFWSICKFVTRSWNWWKYEYGSNWVFCMSGFQLIDPVAKKRMEIDKGLRFEICRDIHSLYILQKVHIHSSNLL